jgi:hypothetical protein
MKLPRVPAQRYGSISRPTSEDMITLYSSPVGFQKPLRHGQPILALILILVLIYLLNALEHYNNALFKLLILVHCSQHYKT